MRGERVARLLRRDMPGLFWLGAVLPNFCFSYPILSTSHTLLLRTHNAVLPMYSLFLSHCRQATSRPEDMAENGTLCPVRGSCTTEFSSL